MLGARSRVTIFLSVLLSSISLPLSAQSKAANARPRLVSAEEGEAIVQAAWELRRGLNPKPDCSHFVQAVYARAGFLYEYAASRDVFAGINGFRKVRKPQPGDLVVWPGHIGIVIDGREHSFYSSVLSGFAIENYQSNYWIRRGNPRFYRFVVNSNWQNAPRPVLSNLAQVRPAPDQAPSRVIHPSPASSQLKASSQPPALMVKAPSQASGRQPAHIEAKAAASTQMEAQASARIKPEASAQVQAPASAQIRTPSAQVQAPASAQIRTPASAQVQAPASAQIQAPASAQIQAPASAQIQAPASAQIVAKAEAAPVSTTKAATHGEVLVSSRAIPTRREVLEAIIRSADDNGERLMRNRQLDSRPSVGVVDRFTIVALEFQGNVGLADVEVKEMAAFRYGTARPYRLTARQRVILNRQKQGWILLDPQDLVYLNRRLAARELSYQLASMPQGAAGQQEVRAAVKILHELMSADAGGSD